MVFREKTTRIDHRLMFTEMSYRWRLCTNIFVNNIIERKHEHIYIVKCILELDNPKKIVTGNGLRWF